MNFNEIVNKCGSKEQIKNAIESLTKENYIQAIDDYLSLDYKKRESLSDFERGYVEYLDKNINTLGRNLIRKMFENKDSEELLAIVVDAHIEHPYDFISECDNDGIGHYLEWGCPLKSGVKFSIVVNFLKDSLNNYSENLTKTKEELSIAKAKSDIEGYKRTIASCESSIKNIEEKFGL